MSNRERWKLLCFPIRRAHERYTEGRYLSRDKQHLVPVLLRNPRMGTLIHKGGKP